MSLYTRTRRKRLRTFKAFMKDAECVNGMYVFQIHEVPPSIDYGDEYDFWIINGKDCFMLRIVKSKEQSIVFTRDSLRNPLYCIMKVGIDSINIQEHLSLLKVIGIPLKIKGQMKRKLQNIL
jgi:hypothetical protein